MLSGMAWAEGLVMIPEDGPDIAEGDTVRFLPFDALLR